MRHITLELIRKRSEHNESLVSNLEEIALHQEELEAVGPILGRASGKTLKILLLQNNIIHRLLPADFRHFKSLEYLNVALNNIEVVEGIGHLEFLNKLDFTLNFIHLDRLKESVACLSQLRSLKELFMIGNPCMNVADDADADADTVASNGKEQSKPRKKNQGWENTRMYLVAKLPQLEYLDGTKITRSERIRANRSISNLEEELSVLALKCREEKQQRKSDENSSKNLSDGGAIGDSEVTEHCPEDRTRLGQEMAEQKAEKEKNEKANQPKFKTEKDYNNEQVESVQSAREREMTGNFKQCNEGRWHFEFDEEKRPGYLTLSISIQKHLSSSLIDVDIHPTFVSVVIKSKVLRLCLPVEVNSDASIAQRSTTTGHLLLIMPKSKPHRHGLLTTAIPVSSSATVNFQREAEEGSKGSLTGPVNIRGLVKESEGGVKQEEIIVERNSSRKASVAIPARGSDSSDDEDESPPPLF